MRSRSVLSVLVCVVVLASMVVPAAAAGMTISGEVVDGQTGEPLEGIEVRVYRAEDAWNDEAHFPTGYSGWTATTDATGTYVIEGLASEPHVVAFCDLGDTYRDMTWPQRGLPVTHAYPVPAEFPYSVDAAMYTFQTVIDNRVQRVAGTNRYRTAMEIVRRNFVVADTAVIVSGEDFPDALSATPLAGINNAPLLLTERDALPSGLTKLLEDLGVAKILVVGGEAVVSPAVVSELQTAGFTSITRIAGSNRYDTSARVAQIVHEETDMWPFVCRGDAFPDALAAGPFAYDAGVPILLTKPHELPAEVTKVWSEMSLQAGNFALIVGGESAVGDEVLDDLAAASLTDNELYYHRFNGADRYETASILVSELYHSYDVYGLATGKNYPDALAGGAAVGYYGGALLLTEPYRLNPHTAAYLDQDHAEVVALEVFGGTAAIADGVMDAAYLKLGREFRDFDLKKIVTRGTLEKAPFTMSLSACDIGVDGVGVYADVDLARATTAVTEMSSNLDISSLEWSVLR